MIDANEICLKVYVTPEIYLALRHRAAELDRTLSQHLRHLVRIDLLQACAAERAQGRGDGGPTEGQEEP
jgi:hypothetical protein